MDVPMIAPYNLTVIQPNIRPVFTADGSYHADALQDNLDHACDLIRAGSRNFASKLFVLPEFFLQGFQPGIPVEAWTKASIQLAGREVETLGKVARDTGAYISGMVYEVMDEYPGRFFNTAIIVAPNGEVVLRYRKLYAMTTKTRPGDVYRQYTAQHGGPASLFPVADTPLGKLGCLVCYDINFPEVTRCLALNGAEIFLHCSSETRSQYHLPDGGWTMARRVRAYENIAYLAMANTGHNIDPGGFEDRSHGESQIVDFNGRVMNIANTSNETMITASIDIEALRRRRAEPRLNFLAELSPGIHAPIYEQANCWPLDHWANTPVTSVEENRAVAREVIGQMTADGTLMAPGQ